MLQGEAESLSHSPNYWIPREQLVEGTAGHNHAERAIAELYAYVSSYLPSDWDGAEYWVQVYEGGRGLAFHFDKDEHAMKQSGVMVNPILSSVLFLTSSSSESSQAPQAPLVLTDQVFDSEIGAPEPADPMTSTLVFPVENSYCIFDGRLGHGVLDSGLTSRRVTLLVNWWAHKPLKIVRAPVTQLTEMADILATQRKIIETKIAEQAYEIQVCEADLDGQELLLVRVTTFPSSTGDERNSLLMHSASIHDSQVDDILLQRQKKLTGASAIQMLRMLHCGLALYPIEAEQLIQGDGPSIQVGAGFMLCCNDSD